MFRWLIQLVFGEAQTHQHRFGAMEFDVSLFLDLQGETRLRQNGLFGEGQVLRKVSDTDTPVDADLALIGDHFAQNHLEQC